MNNEVRWLTVPGGAAVATVAGFTNGATDAAVLHADAPSGPGTGAGITALATNAVQQVTADVDGTAGALLIDNTGASDFMRLNTPRLLAYDRSDTGVVSLNGGAAVGANGTWNQVFTHNLFRVPEWAYAFPTVGGTGFIGYLNAFIARDAATVTFGFRLVNGATLAAGSTSRFFVIAIG